MRKRTLRQGSQRTLSFAAALALIAVLGSVFYLQIQSRNFAHAAPAIHTLGMRLTNPQYWRGGLAEVGMQLPCQAADAKARCYTPRQIQQAYNTTSLLAKHTTGLGHTIVIIDAFQSPTIRHDLKLFDAVFGLKDPKLNIIAPDGLAPFNPQDRAQVSWAAEITLDVEWAHAVAPGATIDLVLSNPTKDPQANTLSGFLQNLLRATAFAVTNNLGEVISQSFGGNENCVSAQVLQAQHQVFQIAAEKNITLLAASGDFGAAQIDCTFTTLTRAVSTPASDPLVTAVGGTTLTANAADGAYMNESGWKGSGGGFSKIFAKPAFQQGVAGITGSGRGVPDVAYDGDPRSGVLVVWSSSGKGRDLALVFGGTSAGSPQWAGITALANEVLGKRIGSLNNVLYRIGKSALAAQNLHDITMGNNAIMAKNANGVLVTVQGFTAHTGWDAVTGLGTPNVMQLVLAIAS